MIPALLHPLLSTLATRVDPDGTTSVEPVAATNNPAHGDYQWNFAFRLAKATRQNPRALAERLAQQISHPLIARVDVAGPGFINLTLDTDALAALFAEPVVALGMPQVGAGQVALVDFSSPNVAKRMHIGHMRSTHIGHALDQLHRAAGYTVIADNHIGDWGTQFGKLIVAWQLWRDDNAYAADPIGELERLYVQFGEVTAKDAHAPDRQALLDRARAETVKLQKGDPDNAALWQQFMGVSLAEFEAVYARMGVQFDVVLGESAYRHMTDAVVAQLKADGVAEQSEGAWIVRFDEPALKDHPFIVQKSDGGSNYATTDLACVQYRMARWSPDRIVYVTDMRQQLHFQQLFAVARRWQVKAELVHAWFGMLVLPEGAMSTRKGNTIRLIDLFDEAVSRARAIVDERNPSLSESERTNIAEAVGLGAVRYADLCQNPQTDVTFTWDKMLAFEGNTAPYLLYSYARCCTLLAKAGESPNLRTIVLAHPLERELALATLRTSEAGLAALQTSRPNLLADHLFDLANRVNRVYHELPVLNGGEARPSRLALLHAAKNALGIGTGWLGLRMIERM